MQDSVHGAAVRRQIFTAHSGQTGRRRGVSLVALNSEQMRSDAAESPLCVRVIFLPHASKVAKCRSIRVSPRLASLASPRLASDSPSRLLSMDLRIAFRVMIQCLSVSIQTASISQLLCEPRWTSIGDPTRFQRARACRNFANLSLSSPSARRDSATRDPDGVANIGRASENSHFPRNDIGRNVALNAGLAHVNGASKRGQLNAGACERDRKGDSDSEQRN